MWNNFEICSSDEETSNNGFCINGLFKIGREEKLQAIPKIKALIQNDKTILAVDQSLILFDNENWDECNFLSFGATIETIAISQSEKLIICGLADGNIHGVFIKGIPVFNLTVNQEDVTEGSAFAGIQQQNDDYLFMCSSGAIYRLTNIDEAKIFNAANQIEVIDSYVWDETLIADLVLEKISSKKYYNPITTFAFIACGAEDVILAANDESLIFYDEKFTSIPITDNRNSIKKILNFDSRTICLTNNGTLIEVCPFTKLIFPLFEFNNYCIEDLGLLENGINEKDILLLLRSISEPEIYSIKVISFPSMNITYELLNVGKSWLIYQSKSSLNMFYIRGLFDETKSIQQIEMKMISEVQPMQRYKKLIRKGFLKEAEEFAKQFKLSMQPVLEEKARQMIRDISTSKTYELEVKFVNLLKLLSEIEDKSFLLTLQYIDIPDRNIMSMLLEYLVKNFDRSTNMKDIDEINERLLRLDTLKIIDPYEHDDDWVNFVNNPNINKLCQKYLKNDIGNACILWARHSSSIVSHLDKKIIAKLLGSISQFTEPFHMVLWMRHFVPSVLHNHPTSMTILVDWSIEQTHNLQISKQWPEVGLEFVTSIYDIFNEINFLFADIRRQYDNNLNKIQTYIQIIKNLALLKTNYYLNISLEEYIENSSEELVFRLLQRVQLCHIKNLVNDFIFKILNENGISSLPVLIRYVEFLVTNRKQIYSWQERSVHVIQLIHNVEEKLKCVLLVMKSAPVPLSNTLTPLIKSCSTSNHPLSSEIIVENEFQTLKIIKVKYDWPADLSENYLKLIFRIVKTNSDDLFDDINTVVKFVPSIMLQAHFYCGLEVVRNGQVERAFNYIASLDSNQRKECCNYTKSIISKMLDEGSIPNSDIPNVVEYLNYITRISKESNDINDIQNVLILRKKFNLDVNLDSITNRQCAMNILRVGCSNIINSANVDDKDCLDVLWDKIYNLSNLLNINPIEAILELLKTSDDIHFSSCMIYLTFEMLPIDPHNIDVIIDLLALLVAQQIKFDFDSYFEFMDPLVFPILMNLINQLIRCKEFNVYYMEMLKFIKIIRIASSYYGSNNLHYKDEEIRNMGRQGLIKLLKKEKNSNEDIKSKPEFRDSLSIFENFDVVEVNSPKVQNDSEEILKLIIATIKIVMFVIKVDMLPFYRISNYLGDTPFKKEKLSTDFFSLLESVLKNKHHKIVFNIVQIIKTFSNENGTFIMPDTFITMICKKIIKYGLLAKEFVFTDIMELISVVLSVTNSKSFLEQIQNELKTETQKMNYLTLLESYQRIKGNNEQAQAVKECRIKNYYSSEFKKNSYNELNFISISHFMNGLNNKIVDIELLKKLSEDFNWNFQDVLVTQIITILSIQNLDYDIVPDAFGKDQINVKSSSEQIYDLCQPYIQKIENADLLATNLLAFFDKINFYFYELYLCTIKILAFFNKLPQEMLLWSDILSFLKYEMITKRRNNPGQIETDLWLKSKFETVVLPKISKYRFPFKPIVQGPLKLILDDELSVENCVKWFPLIKLHTNLKSNCTMKDIMTEIDYYCKAAVKNCIGEYKSTSEDPDSEKWNLKPINNAFLNSVLQLMKQVINRTNIIFILYFVTNHAPLGADLVQAAYECYKFAIEHEEEICQMEKAKEIVVKIKRKYPILKTQHLLHLHNLNDESLFQMIENPQQLIIALYNHESVLKFDNRPNINKIANEIANYYELDLNVIQTNLLQNWLSFSLEMDNNGLDETLYEDVNITISESDEINEEFIIRAHFLLSSWNNNEAIGYLISQIYTAEGGENTCNVKKQLYLIECFNKLIDESNISYTEVLNQEKYMIIKCVYALKNLGFNITLQKFENVDKMQFLTTIWKSHANKEKGIEVMSYICLGYNIFIPQIWNGILKQMIKLNMIKHLSSLIDILSTKSQLLHIDGLAIAWETVIMSTFKDGNKNRSFEEDARLGRALILLQTCPVASKINLVRIAEECIRLKRPHMAAILISFSNGITRSHLIELIKKYKTDTIKRDISELEDMGILSIITSFVIHELEL